MLLMKSLSLRRLACVPWLLTVGLVLGWSGEAVADAPPEGDEANHSRLSGHMHTTDPYFQVSFGLQKDGTADSVVVSWDRALSRNFHNNDATSNGNGTQAAQYTVSLFKGELPSPADVASADAATAAMDATSRLLDAGATDSHTFVPGTTTGLALTAASFSDVLVLDFENPASDTNTDVQTQTGPGLYWVRLTVQVPDGDQSGQNWSQYFTRQIAVKPEYKLSVNPKSVREDADPTDITVSVTANNQVNRERSVPVQLRDKQPGFNTRFRIETTTLTIPANQTYAERTIRFTPVDDDDSSTNDFPDDDFFVTLRTVGADNGNGSAEIQLVDTDKPTTQIDLSFSRASLSKNDPTTSIVVTATLNGGKVRKDLRFPLIIDETRTMAGGTGLIRDDDYSATMAPLTIPDRRVSGKATIVISPKNKDIGPIWVTAGGEALVYNGQTIRVNPSFILLTALPTASVEALTATPYSIREDAGAKEVTLEVTLKNAVSTDETVTLTIDPGTEQEPASDKLTDARYDGAIDATRDIEYAMNPPSIPIPQGETKGSATVTVTPVNNTDENDLRVISIIATLDGVEVGRTGILITDDDSTSEQIKLTVSPDEINENAGATEVTVTGTLQGNTFDDDLDVFLTIDGTVDGAASRDVDYTTVVPKLVIEGGETQGAKTFTITPVDNDGSDDNEIIRIKGLDSQKPSAEDEFGDIQELTVGFVDITLRDSGAEAEADEDDGEDSTTPADPTKPSFAAATVDDQTYTVDTAIDDLELPEAAGGDAPITYSVSTLPAGLAFDSATRMLTGTPTTATDGAVNIIYTAIDNDRDASALIFAITVNEAEMTPPTAETGDAQLTATPSAVREDGGDDASLFESELDRC